MRQPQRAQELLDELAALRTRLVEVEETLTAIRQGRVDAIVMDGPQGEAISTLQGADQPYRVMIESMQEGAITLAADGTILYSNDSFAWLVRSPLEQVVGTSMSHFIAAADQPQFAVLLEHGLAVRCRGELQITTSDGTHIPVLLSLTSLRAYEVPAVCVVVTDLTDQKRYAELAAAQEALQESERRFRAIFDQTFQFIWLLTPEGIVLEANQSALTFVGLTAAEVVGRPFHETTWWTGSPALQRRVQEAIRAAAAGEFVRYEAEIRGAAAQTAVIDFSLKAVRGDSGRVVLLIPEGRNITEHKHAEKALRESEAKFATAFQLNPLPMALMTMGGRYVEVNDAAERRFGYSRTEMLGRTSTELGLHLDPQRRKTFYQLLRQDGRVREFEAVWLTKNGDRRTFLISAESLMLQGKRYLLAVNNDITTRKQAEAERERLLAEFQQFSYIVSHDLNEPLRTMSNYVQLLARRAKGKLDGPAEEYVAFVTDAAKRMQQMLSDLLAYTHAGQAPEFQSVDCEEMLAQMVSDLHAAITEQQATLTHDPLPTIRGDATRLKQVLQNLIGNALKFRGQAPPRVHVSARREDGHWRFAVRDNGIGIDPQQVGKLFQVFQRLHTRSEYAGSGIGLAICKKIVEQHGGRIWVESRPRGGSIFYFTISDNKTEENCLLERLHQG